MLLFLVPLVAAAFFLLLFVINVEVLSSFLESLLSQKLLGHLELAVAFAELPDVMLVLLFLKVYFLLEYCREL